MNCNIGIGNRIKINPTWWKETWKNQLPIETLLSTVNDNKFVVSYLNVCQLRTMLKTSWLALGASHPELLGC